jgi:hypothetical protein
MGSSYWRVELIKPEEPGDNRCVMLHGQLEEIVGPMTLEMAEAWMDQFDNRQAAQQGSTVAGESAQTPSSVPPPKLKAPKEKPAG